MSIDKGTRLFATHYKHDMSWIPEYTDNYIIFEKGESYKEGCQNINLDESKVIKQVNVGENIYDLFDVLSDRRELLRDVNIFVKSDCLPRHCKKDKFDRIINNKVFTPLESYEHEPETQAHIKAPDGNYMEINNSWYLNHHPSKYFRSLNEFLTAAFINPLTPKYIRFAPGGNYIITREDIDQYPPEFYRKLKKLVSWAKVPGEAHMLERALYSIFTCKYEINPVFLK